MLKGLLGALLILISVVASVLVARVATGASDVEAEMLRRINSSREESGLNPLQVDAGLTSHARHHTQAMIEGGGLFHSSSTELKAAAGSGWTSLAENVGKGHDVAGLHAAFMNSPSHRSNILGSYEYVGIGIGEEEGVLYVTVVFMAMASSSPTATTARQPATPPSKGPTPEPDVVRPAFPGPCTALWWACPPRPI